MIDQNPHTFQLLSAKKTEKEMEKRNLSGLKHSVTSIDFYFNVSKSGHGAYDTFLKSKSKIKVNCQLFFKILYLFLFSVSLFDLEQ